MIARTSKTKTRSNEDALAAFVQKKAEIDAMLDPAPGAQRRSLRRRSPTRSPGAMSARLGHYAELLKRITDSAFNEGEHAA